MPVPVPESVVPVHECVVPVETEPVTDEMPELSYCDSDLTPIFARGHYKQYTLKEKLVLVQQTKEHGLRVVARKNRIPVSTLSTWCKKDFSAATNLHNGHETKSGRPVSYGDDIDQYIEGWVLEQRDLQIPVSIDNLCEYARSVVKDPSFKASRCWATHFMRRHEFSLRQRTSIAQKLPADLEVKLSSFREFVSKSRADDEFDFRDMINMDETPMYFDLVPQHTIDKIGSRSVLIRSTGSEKRHVTVVLAVSAAGDVLPPMIVFKGVRKLKLNVPKGWVVTVQPKAWMDETLMVQWVKEILLPFTKKNRSLCILDSFRGHLTTKVKDSLRRGNSVMGVIPGGCTSKLQPLDVSLNKPFKCAVRKSWCSYIRSNMEDLRDGKIDRVRAPSKQHIVDWVQAALPCLTRDMVAKSFKVCGISNHTNGCEDHLVANPDILPPELVTDDKEGDFEGFTNDDVATAIKKLKHFVL